MAVAIQLEPSVANQELSVTIDEWDLVIKAHWNARDSSRVVDDDGEESGPDGAWYVDITEDNGNLVVLNVKLVLGVNLGRTSMHAFFAGRILRLVDTSNSGKECGFDELGRRCQLVSINLFDP